LRTSAAASDGFYDGIIFRRVIPDFMIQGGCPEGTGTGGPGYTFGDEFNDHEGGARRAGDGLRGGPNTNGSQFFIVTTDSAPWLDGKDTVFGPRAAWTRWTRSRDRRPIVPAPRAGRTDRGWPRATSTRPGRLRVDHIHTIDEPPDVERAIDLFRRSYDRARQARRSPDA